MTATRQTACECNREFATHQGLMVHIRTCVVERKRSEIFVNAVQNAVDPHQAVANWQAAGRALTDEKTSVPLVDLLAGNSANA